MANLGSGLGIRFGGFNPRTMEDVSDWADKHGGELAVRNALANGEFSLYSGTVEKWLSEVERRRADSHAVASLQADQRSALAAERAARWSMWSALVSAAVGLGSAAAYWLSRVPI